MLSLALRNWNKRNIVRATDDVPRLVIGPRWIPSEEGDTNGYIPEVFIVLNGNVLFRCPNHLDAVEFYQDKFWTKDVVVVDLRNTCLTPGAKRCTCCIG